MSTETSVVASAACPECGGTVPFERAPMSAEVVVCGGCSAELEVVFTSPLRLALAPEVQEDWGE